MATIKSYTDISQSKKLAEILPHESADMWWAERYEGRVLENGQYVVNDTPYYYLSIVQPSSNNYSQDTVKDVPCWSLAALLDILPMLNDRTPIISKTFDKKYRVVYHSTAYERAIITNDYDNPIDACYEMIIKLNEFKML